MQRSNAVAIRVDERSRNNDADTAGMLTPARRAGLEALERELSDLLNAYQNRHGAAAAA